MMNYRQNDNCTNDIKQGKDDEIMPDGEGVTMFIILFIIFFLCALYAIAATILLVHDMRKNPRTQLIIFYIFANLTLIRKSDPTTKTLFSESLLLC